MGLIRLLLALAVVSAHSNSSSFLKLSGGEVAVQAFFIISGFYMAMIAGSYKSVAVFWLSRYLRLFPAYLVCGLLTLFFHFGVVPYEARVNELPVAAIAFLGFTNLTMLFQDITMFLGVDNTSLHAVAHFQQSSPPLYQLLLVPQGWSLGLELSFYLFVPFLLVRKTSAILIALLLSAAIKIAIISFGMYYDPWSHRFFPAELSTFLLGSLAFRYRGHYPAWASTQFARSVTLTVLIFFIAIFAFVPVAFEIKRAFLLIFLTLTIANVFELTKSSNVDQLCGALSYPIYVSHLFVLDYIVPKVGLPLPSGDVVSTLFAFVAIIVFSILIYFSIERPVEQYRKRLKSSVRRQAFHAGIAVEKS